MILIEFSKKIRRLFLHWKNAI